jgi:hypothetical protein
LVALMKFNPQPFDEFGPACRNALERAALLVAMLAALWGALAAGKSSTRAFLGFATVLVLWMDLFWHAPNQVLTAPISVMAPDLARQRGQPIIPPDRGRAMMSRAAREMMYKSVLTKPDADFLGKRLSAFSNCNLLDHLPKVDGFYALYTAWQFDIVSAAGVSGGCPEHLADFLAITHVTAPDDVFGWMPRPTALPLATAGMSPVFLDHDTIKRRMMAGDFDPRREILLPLEARDRTQTKTGSPAIVTIREFAGSTMVLNVSNGAPAWVAIAETYYPNWHAYVDGKPAQVWRANHAFQAVEIPAGAREVRLVYEDRAFHAGLAISALALAVCGGLWWRRRPLPQ